MNVSLFPKQKEGHYKRSVYKRFRVDVHVIDDAGSASDFGDGSDADWGIISC